MSNMKQRVRVRVGIQLRLLPLSFLPCTPMSCPCAHLFLSQTLQLLPRSCVSSMVALPFVSLLAINQWSHSQWLDVLVGVPPRPQKQHLRQGFWDKWFVWVMVPGNTSGEVRQGEQRCDHVSHHCAHLELNPRSSLGNSGRQLSHPRGKGAETYT